MSGLWLLGLLVPLVALYILKIRRARVRVASTWLWAAARRDLLAKSPFRRLIAEIPLVLQILALILLALALARPATRGKTLGGNHIALVIDTSASMTATGPGGKPRIAEAKEAAMHLIARLSPGANAMIIEAGRDPRIASPLDRDARRLEAAVTRISAQEVEGNLTRAIAVASDRLRQVPGAAGSERRIVVISDGAVADTNALASATLPVDLVKVGSPVDNAGIVRFDVRSGTDPATKREQIQAFALVVNYGSKPRDVFVTLRQRNVSEPLAARKIQLSPEERAPVVLTFEPARGDAGSGLVVELSPGDALAADDRAYGRVPVGRKLPVVLAPPDGSPWMKRALLADPDVELSGAALAALGSHEIPEDALIVIDGACPPTPIGGDVVILNPPPGPCRTAVVGRRLERPSITSWSESDPRLRFLTLDGVDVLEAHEIEVAGPRESLVRTSDAVVVADISLPGRAGTLLAFDVGNSNWPLKASFVLFVRNVIELARAHRAQGLTGPVRTGQPMRVKVPADVGEVAIEGPDGQLGKLPARSGLAIVPEVSRAGFYHLSWQGTRRGSVLVGANLTSELESDARPRQLEAGGKPVQPALASDGLDALNELSWMLAAFALLLLLLDIWWLTRRVRVRSPLDRERPRLPERARDLRRREAA